MKSIVISIVFSLVIHLAYGQSPEGFSYQAVIRGADNALLANQRLGIRVSILQGNIDGPAVYSEIHDVSTNTNGLYSLQIGNGNVFSGTFNIIDWADGPYFISTETDPEGGSNYTIVGTSQLLSVPYALHAKTAQSVVETDPEFAASPASTITNEDKTNWSSKLDGEADPVFSSSPASDINDDDITSWNNKLDNETDPDFAASPASTITDEDKTSWNNKLDTETDPDFTASPASTITNADKTNWDNKLDSEVDPVFSASAAAGIISNDITSWNNKLDTETDPDFAVSPASGITNADMANWNNKLDSEADGDPNNEIQDLELTNHNLTVTNNPSATSISLLPYLTNTALNGTHAATVQNVPFTNLVFTPIDDMLRSIDVTSTSERFLILGSARLFGGSLSGASSSIGGYFLILERSTTVGFESAEILTYMAGNCYIETPDDLNSASIGFSNGTTVHYVDQDLTPGTYYYRLVFVPNGVGITGGSYTIYQRDLNILEVK